PATQARLRPPTTTPPIYLASSIPPTPGLRQASTRSTRTNPLIAGGPKSARGANWICRGSDQFSWEPRTLEQAFFLEDLANARDVFLARGDRRPPRLADGAAQQGKRCLVSRARADMAVAGDVHHSGDLGDFPLPFLNARPILGLVGVPEIQAPFV